jgi:hypothetical protein
MQHYVDFGECCRPALDFVDTEMRTRLASEQKKALLESQQQLPAFPDCDSGLSAIA